MATPANVSYPEPEDGRLGIAAASTLPALQSDFYKELINKLAWVLGGSYHLPYSNTRSVAREVARNLASDVIRTHGYARHLAGRDLPGPGRTPGPRVVANLLTGRDPDA